MIYKFFNISILWLGLLVIAHAESLGSISDQVTLNQADSLFEKKKYTEALQRYLSLYEAEKSSPAMMLRMAYIHEGLGKDVEAIYYLHQYYTQTADRAVLSKITELAEANDLSGYEYSDAEYLFNLLDRYRISILLALVAVMILSVVLIRRAKRHSGALIPPFVLQIVSLILLFIFTNRLFETNQGIISSQHTLLMNGPSAGATPLQALGKGNKVRVLDVDAVWTKVQWHDQVGFVRNNRILPI